MSGVTFIIPFDREAFINKEKNYENVKFIARYWVDKS